MENSKITGTCVDGLTNPFHLQSALQSESGVGAPKLSVGEILLNFIGGMRLFMSQSDAYASVSVAGAAANIEVQGRAFRELLLSNIYKNYNVIPKKRELAEAIELAASLARVSGVKVELQNRFCFDNSTLTWDLGREDGAFVIADQGGWRVECPQQHQFLKHPHHSPLPLPDMNGDILEIRQFLNIADENALILVIVWIVAAFIGTIPRPILCLHGSQGSAKTTLARMLKSIIDPTEQGGIYVRNKDDELAQIMSKSAVPFFDNLTKITKSVENLLCMGVTGGGFEKRKLYTDSESVIFKFKRPIIITGINIPYDAQDLIDRTIGVELVRIDETTRRYESEINQEFELLKPRIMGGILNTLSGAMRRIDGITLSNRPRMADFAKWGSAIADEIGADRGFGAERFQQAMTRAIEDGYRSSVAGDKFANCFLAFLSALEADGRSVVTGLVSECHQGLLEFALKKDRTTDHIPPTSQSFSQVLKKYLPVLEVNGWKTTFSTTRRSGRKLSFEKIVR